MLRITKSTSAQRAKSYFKNSLKVEDATNYYTDGHEIVGTWGGLGAERLGLSGEVRDSAFFALCDNMDPASGERLTVRTRKDRRVGFDFTFSVPKSISIHQALLDHPEMGAAFGMAVADTMKSIEQRMNTRIRKGGAWADRNTANMVWAGFTHHTARPVEGKKPSAHLHRHVYCFNATFDETEGRWKAGEFNELHLMRPYMEAIFHSKLSENIRQLGYEVERTGRDFELKHYTKALRDKFSDRTLQIERIAKERNIVDPKKRAELGARTRAGKDKETPADLLRDDWWERLSSEEFELVRKVEEGRDRGSASEETTAPFMGGPAEQCVAYAIGESFERRSVVKRHEFLTSALCAGMDRVTVEQIHAAFEDAVSDGRLIVADWEGEACVTTPEVQAEEKRMLAYVREGQGRREPFYLETEPLPPSRTDQERPADWDAAAREVLSSRDEVTMLVGKPGSGKTTTLQTIADSLALRGQTIFAFAPSAVASRENLVRAGFEDAETLATLFVNEDLQEACEGQTILVDEAGLLGARDACRVFEIAAERNARVLLVGDPAQLKSVSRGDALRVIETFGQIEAARLDRIRRQQNEDYRQAVEDLAEGRVKEGFQRLVGIDAVREIDDWAERGAALAQDYATVRGKGKSVVVVAPTHAERRRANVEIRGELQFAGLVDATDERLFTKWESEGFAEWQKRDWVYYEEGQKIRWQKAAPGFATGSTATVVEISDKTVSVEKMDGSRALLPLELADRFDVFQEGEVTLAAGDRIRITRNGLAKSRDLSGRRQRLTNGRTYEVKGFTEDGDIVLDNDFTVDRNYFSLDLGYALTVNASQSLDEDVALLAQPEATFAASNASEFLVAVSRGRSELRIYTDDRAGLEQAVQRSADRVSATELLQEAPSSEPEAVEASDRSRLERLRDWVLTLVHRYEDSGREREGENIERRSAEFEQSRGPELPGRERERG